MEKNNSNIIVRNDGNQVVGYVADLQMYFAKQAQKMLEICATKMVEDSYDDEDFKKVGQYVQVARDLSQYTERDALIKADYETYGYWSISFIF